VILVRPVTTTVVAAAAAAGATGRSVAKPGFASTVGTGSYGRVVLQWCPRAELLWYSEALPQKPGVHTRIA